MKDNSASTILRDIGLSLQEIREISTTADPNDYYHFVFLRNYTDDHIHIDVDGILTIVQPHSIGNVYMRNNNGTLIIENETTFPVQPGRIYTIANARYSVLQN